jgi:transketolase
VGEDGPTHEPVEQEAQIRLMEKLRNHSGLDSVRVFRPCDGHATTECWKMAMENMSTPTALIFSRQNVKDLPNTTDYTQVKYGAYNVVEAQNPNVILIGSGSEVSTLAEAYELLKADGVVARVVSCPSEGLFRRQSKEYQEQILPKDSKVFALTAGLPVIFQGLVGDKGRVYGLESFGFSAPFTVLDEKLGFTPENIRKEILSFLAE